MKKKIVISVPMHCDDAKSKAMKIAVCIPGVSSVSIGEDDQLVVIGEGVDSVRLGKYLRRKFCFADIISVEQVKPPIPPLDPTPLPSPNKEPCPLQYYYPPPPPLYYECRPVCDAAPPNCTTM